MLTIRAFGSIFSLAVITLGAGMAPAQEYPSKTIRFSTVPPGGGTDFTARYLAAAISGPLGQPVIVENRPTNVATELVVRAPPDGYTILVVGSGMWVQPLMQKKPPWDPVNDFAPITIAINQPNIVLVHPSLPVKSIKELIALAKARPGELHYTQGTAGGNSHLSGELFNSMAGVNILGIPYRANTGGLTALLSGEVQVAFAPLPSSMQYMKSGRLRVLAVSAPQRLALAPDIPTVEASGLRGYYMGSHHGIWAPAKTPAPIIRRLNQEIVRALNTPDAKAKFLEQGAEPNGNSPEEMAAYIKNDIARLAKVVKDANIPIE